MALRPATRTARLTGAAVGDLMHYPCRTMKTHTIELQRIKSMSNSHGLVRARVDAAVQAAQARDDDSPQEPSSILVLTVENARVLVLLLKQQLADVDAKKARSQR